MKQSIEIVNNIIVNDTIGQSSDGHILYRADYNNVPLMLISNNPYLYDISLDYQKIFQQHLTVTDDLKNDVKAVKDLVLHGENIIVGGTHLFFGE